jgi:hypothetical protein
MIAQPLRLVFSAVLCAFAVKCIYSVSLLYHINSF